jgi:hypothetical protein
MPIVLSGMRDRRRFELDCERGTWTRTPEVLGDGGVAGFSGFADIRRVGLVVRRSVFVAVYALDGHAWLRVGESTFNLDDPGILVLRSAVAPMVKAFEVRARDTQAIRLHYWWGDLHEWPDDDILDIFLYVASHLANARDRRRMVALWSLLQKGLSASEASAIVEQSGVDGGGAA